MCKFGQKKSGVEHGGAFIIKHMTRSNSLTPLTPITPLTPPVVINSCQDYAKGYHANAGSKNFNLNLGGDHSISACTIQPYINKYGSDLLVLWIDAHADVNTHLASTSKNRHGMPVAALLGLMPHWYDTKRKTNHVPLLPHNLVYYGLRDTDPFEERVLKWLNIRVFKTFNKEIIPYINKHPAKFIYISCDIDALDPSIMPSTGTPVAKGLKLEDVLMVIKNTQKTLVGADLVEFNPSIGNEKEVRHTVRNIRKILTALIPR
jgi:arginase